MGIKDGISLTCPKCHHRLRVQAAAAGKRVRCPNGACGAVIAVPRAAHPGPRPPRPDTPEATWQQIADSAPQPEAKLPRPRSRTRPWLWVAGAAAAVPVIIILALALRLGGRLGDLALPRDGAGDPALTYDEVSKNVAKYRGKRVTWPFVFCSSENETALCSLDPPAARRPGAYGMYLVKFASVQEVNDDRVVMSGFSGGSTITGTVAGEVEAPLVHRDRFGVPQDTVPNAKLPLLLYPAFGPPGRP